MWKSIVLAVIGCVALSSAVSAACSAYPYTLTNGTTADASQVMANFNCVLGSPVFSGPVGIGMTPTNVLDITQNQNADAKAEIANTNTGAAARAAFWATNGGQNTVLTTLGTGYTPNGVNQPGYSSLESSSVLNLFSGNAILFATNNSSTEIARFGTDGSFLIGTTTNGGWTGVAKIESKVSSGNGIPVSAYTAGTNSAFFGRVDSTSTNLVTWNYQGTLDTGSITTNGTSVAYNTTSDERLKRDLGPATDISELEGLKVHDFAWMSSGQRDVGVFAQETYKVMPRVVTKGGVDPHERPWMVDYSKFAPDLIVGWQNHEKRIDALEKENAQLMSDVSAQELKSLKAANDDQAAQIRQLQVEVSALERKAGVRTAQR